MVIVVTGTPGTGKTTFAKELALKHGSQSFDLHEFIVSRGLSAGTDEERDSLIVDEQALVEALLPKVVANPNLVIDGHMSHEIPREHVTKCYITKCQLPVLKQRLEARGYSEAKVRENLDAEIFDICFHEAQEHHHNIEVIWT